MGVLYFYFQQSLQSAVTNGHTDGQQSRTSRIVNNKLRYFALTPVTGRCILAYKKRKHLITTVRISRIRIQVYQLQNVSSRIRIQVYQLPNVSSRIRIQVYQLQDVSSRIISNRKLTLNISFIYIDEYI